MKVNGCPKNEEMRQNYPLKDHLVSRQQRVKTSLKLVFHIRQAPSLKNIRVCKELWEIALQILPDLGNESFLTKFRRYFHSHVPIYPTKCCSQAFIKRTSANCRHSTCMYCLWETIGLRPMPSYKPTKKTKHSHHFLLALIFHILFQHFKYNSFSLNSISWILLLHSLCLYAPMLLIQILLFAKLSFNLI